MNSAKAAPHEYEFAFVGMAQGHPGRYAFPTYELYIRDTQRFQVQIRSGNLSNRLLLIEIQPTFNHPIKHPNAIGNNHRPANQNTDDGETKDNSNRQPQQRPPKRADLPIEMGFEPRTFYVFYFDVIQYHADHGGKPSE